MATVNKSDRKKLVSTQTVGTVLVWHRVDTGEELCRVDSAALDVDIVEQLIIYGMKQIVADVAANVDGEERFNTIKSGAAAIGCGQWPRRAAAPASMEPALTALMVNMGITRAKAREMLGMAVE